MVPNPKPWFLTTPVCVCLLFFQTFFWRLFKAWSTWNT
jgi:hypothetical protein